MTNSKLCDGIQPCAARVCNEVSMANRTRVCMAAVAFIFTFCFSELGAAVGQTVVNGSDLVLRSNGAVTGTDATLTENGFAGTYIAMAAPGTVVLSVRAFGQAGGGA